jgi:alkylation response protein AidB-like acyl-CoA dehydrogenase
MTSAHAEEARSINALVHAFAGERVKPRAAEIDAGGEFPWDLVGRLGDPSRRRRAGSRA